MDSHSPPIGIIFYHLQSNGNKKSFINTNIGFLPDDENARKRAWELGYHCDNGMKNCMSREEFQGWWANQIERKYKQYMASKSQA